MRRGYIFIKYLALEVNGSWVGYSLKEVREVVVVYDVLREVEKWVVVGEIGKVV